MVRGRDIIRLHGFSTHLKDLLSVEAGNEARAELTRGSLAARNGGEGSSGTELRSGEREGDRLRAESFPGTTSRSLETFQDLVLADGRMIMHTNNIPIFRKTYMLST